MRYVMSVALILILICTIAYAATRAKVLRRVVQSTVVIATDRHSFASGTVVGKFNNYSFVLTCNHVVDGATRFIIHPTEDPTDYVEATVLKTDPAHDLALLLASTYLPSPSLKIADHDPERYETVYIIGNAFNKAGTASEAIVSDLDGHDDALPLTTVWRLTGGFVFYGVSGGTAVNAAGELVCVPNMIEIAPHGENDSLPLPQMGYCIPRDKVIEFVGGYASK